MTTRQQLTTLALGVLAWITLLGVFVFVDEPQPVGGQAPHFHAPDVAYLAVPFVLVAAAAYTPLRIAVRRIRSERHESA